MSHSAKILLIRIFISILFLLLSLYFINAGMELFRPNSILVNYDRKTHDYTAKIDLDTGDGFGRNKLDSGQASDDYFEDIESLSIVFKSLVADPEPVGIKSIAMHRYAGRFDFYNPYPLKVWPGEEILKEYVVTKGHDNYHIENDILFFSSDFQLEYRDNFESVYAEMDQSIANYSYWLSIVAAAFSILISYLSGIYLANIERIKNYFDSKGYAFPISSKLFCVLVFCVIWAVLVPSYVLKLPFIMTAIGSGSAILYLNRQRLGRGSTSFKMKPCYVYLLLFIAIALGVIAFSYKLGEHELREDEFQVVDAAAGYYYEGDYYHWNWLEGEPGERYYDRAFPHTVLIAQSYKLFGISEWSSRIVSVVFGVLFLAILFIVVRYFSENTYLALLIVYLAVAYDAYIYIFRYARMYALLIPLFLLLIYFIYRGITESSFKVDSHNSLIKGIERKFNYNYTYLFLALATLYLSYLIHINALVILPATLLFVFIIAYKTRAKKYLNLTIIGCIGIISILLAYYFGLTQRSMHFISFFERRNYEYIEYLSQHPFPWEVGFVLLALGFTAIVLANELIRNKLLYLYIIIGFSLLFFIFIADRYNHFIYTSHITPISMMLIFFGGFNLLKAMNSRLVSCLFIGVFLFYVGLNIDQNIDRLYTDSHRYGNHGIAYRSIVDNYNPENEVIFGQYLKTYYLRELESKEVETVDMLNLQRYSFESFMTDLQQYEAGWVTWETRKARHLEPDIIDFIEDNFEKIHGRGVDRTRVELYYFEQPEQFIEEKYLLDKH